MSYTLVLNNKNLVGTGNNIYQYNFLQGNFNIPDDTEIMVANCQIPYSFYNITTAYNNNKFVFNFPSGSSTYTTIIITIPDGFYTTTSLNNYLQNWMISNGYYLINSSTGQNVYYIQMVYNTYQYGNQLLFSPVPTSLPAGYSLPSGYTTGTIFGGNGFPTVSRTPYITIYNLTNNSFGNFLGFGNTSTDINIPATIPTITSYSINSTSTPIGSTINSIIMRCSIVKNNVSTPNDILDSFSITANTAFGTNINYTPAIPKWVKVSGGSFSNFIITFTDQNYNLLPALDSNILITLLLKFPDKKNNSY